MVSSGSCVVPTCQMHQSESTGALWWTMFHTYTTRQQGLCMSGTGHTSQTILVLHLRAQGLEEGHEHPPTLSCRAWSTFPFTFTSLYVITVRQHQTIIAGEQKSAFLDINASIIQGSGLGPVFYILNVSDLHPLYSSNILFRYADDTYTS